VLEGSLVTLEDSSEDKKPERLTHWRGKEWQHLFRSVWDTCTLERTGWDRLGKKVCVLRGGKQMTWKSRIQSERG
jgi:hypothetical protein